MIVSGEWNQDALRDHPRTEWTSTRGHFGDAPIRVRIHASEETVEIFVEADFETHAEERRRFAIVSVPRHLFSEATGEAARRTTNTIR